MFIIVGLRLSSQIPPLPSDSRSLPPPCADTVVRARAPKHKRVSSAHSSPPSLSVSVLSHSFRYSVHALQLGAGGAGLHIYHRVEAMSFTQTGPTCSAKTTSKKTPKPGVEVPTFFFLGAWREERLVLWTVLELQRCRFEPPLSASSSGHSN